LVVPTDVQLVACGHSHALVFTRGWKNTWMGFQ
jgi:hypothetical protein